MTATGVSALFSIKQGQTVHVRRELGSLGIAVCRRRSTRAKRWRRPRKIGRDWAGRCTYQGRWRDEVLRSLLRLKALTYAPTGGIVAAPTASLPEEIGGVRNWDYRYCWIRDATLTLQALLVGGYADEALAWRDWLARAVAGDPARLQIMYGLAGERRLTEFELHGSLGTRSPGPCASETVPVTSSNSTCTVKLWAASTPPARRGSRRMRRPRVRCGPSLSTWRKFGSGPTREFGRCAVGGCATSPTQSPRLGRRRSRDPPE